MISETVHRMVSSLFDREIDTMARRTKKEDATTIGKRIAEIRREKGFTQVELAERLGVSQAAISEYERGGSRLALPTLIRLATILETSVDEILGFKISDRPRPSAARLWTRLRKVEDLPEADRKTVLRVIDGLVARQAKS